MVSEGSGSPSREAYFENLLDCELRPSEAIYDHVEEFWGKFSISQNVFKLLHKMEL